MATLIEVRNSQGVVGRCDAHCHAAETPECHCICGGRYHGKARDGTLEETVRRDGAAILEAARKTAAEHGWTISEQQLSLMFTKLQTAQGPAEPGRA